MPEDIPIKDFHIGIGESEFTGNGEITNVDTSWRKGVTRISLESTNSSAGTVTAEVTWITSNPENPNQLWALDLDGQVYMGTASTETWSKSFTESQAQGTSLGGLVIWKDHVLIVGDNNAGQTVFEFSTPISEGNLSVQTSNVFDGGTATGEWHPLIVGQDDIVYGGAGNIVFSLQEVDGQDFQSGTTATFTLTENALDLPEHERIRTLGEQGKYLMIGAWVGDRIDEVKSANIYPWDRSSDSFNLPIRLSENGIHAMVSENNLLYFFAGTDGKLHATDGTNVEELMQIPQQVLDLSGGAFIDIYPGAMIVHDGKVVFGIHNPQGDTSHVWSYNIQDGSMKRESTISSGTASSARVASLYSTGRDDYWTGFTNANGSTAIDHIQTSQRYTNYSAMVTGPYLVIGTKQKPVGLTELEISLARPLATGEGVRVFYRTDLSASFTLIRTIDFATDGAVQEEQANIPKLTVPNGVQIRALLTTGSGSSTSPELIRILLR